MNIIKRVVVLLALTFAGCGGAGNGITNALGLTNPTPAPIPAVVSVSRTQNGLNVGQGFAITQSQSSNGVMSNSQTLTTDATGYVTFQDQSGRYCWTSGSFAPTSETSSGAYCANVQNAQFYLFTVGT